MRSRVLIDFAFILLLYGIYAAIVIWIYGTDRLTGRDPEIFPLIVLGVSLACMLIWYVVGEWMIPPHARAGTWYATWFLLLAVIVVTAAVTSFLESKFVGARDSLDKLLHSDAGSYPALHFLGGIGFFYLGSLLFSPESAKYRIWPAGHVRTW